MKSKVSKLVSMPVTIPKLIGAAVAPHPDPKMNTAAAAQAKEAAKDKKSNPFSVTYVKLVNTFFKS